MAAGKICRPPGTVIGGKYEILKKIGEGGMSTVYLAMDLHLKTNWALKEVDREAADAGETASLLTETEMLKRLSHPRLPRIVDIIDGENSWFIVEDYIPGRTLCEILREEGARAQEDVLQWADQLCEVLDYLHSQKPPIIYRDMKPGNIMLKPGIGVVLFDFGIAREYKANALEDTRPYGTPGYAAPEQMSGNGQSDVRTDIYNLGATLYHLATGENPRARGHEPLAIRRVDPALSQGLEKIILKCTRTDPGERYASCAELRFDLARYDHLEASYRKKQKRKAAAFAAPLLISAAAFGGALFCHRGLLEEQRYNYNLLINEARVTATESIYRRSYEPEVLSAFLRAIDLDPSREEGYLGLLSYAARAGETKAGLDAVCARIDQGSGGIDQSDEVLLKTAQLYFEGNDEDADFVSDYGKAAKYFGKIDGGRIPEAVYFARLSEALGSFLGETDWKEIAAALEEFGEYNEKQLLSVRRIRNDQLAAGVYMTGRRELSELGVAAAEKAICLLERALEGTKNLQMDEAAGSGFDPDGELSELYRQLLWELAADYCLAGASGRGAEAYDRSMALYTELLGQLSDPEEVRRVRFRLAEACRLKGEASEIRKMYDKLVSWYPKDINAWTAYASWLYEEGDLAEAAAMYRRACACESTEENPNLESLGFKLANAGAL